jgi:hypothetical protein
MPLHGWRAAAIGGAMKIRGITLCLGLALLLPACRKSVEKVEMTREQTMRDQDLKLDATSSERFGNTGTGPIIAGMIPEGWQEMPGNQFRLLSYHFGTGGDVAVGLAAGGMAENVNRWLHQFAKEPLGDAAMARLEQGTVTGIPGLWVEAEGDYIAGMGQTAKPGQALYGIIAEKDGRIVTVKMTGPAAEVAAEKPKLKAFVAALRERGQ